MKVNGIIMFASLKHEYDINHSRVHWSPINKLHWIIRLQYYIKLNLIKPTDIVFTESWLLVINKLLMTGAHAAKYVKEESSGALCIDTNWITINERRDQYSADY